MLRDKLVQFCRPLKIFHSATFSLEKVQIAVSTVCSQPWKKTLMLMPGGGLTLAAAPALIGPVPP